jgi:hypothetical protein
LTSPIFKVKILTILFGGFIHFMTEENKLGKGKISPINDIVFKILMTRSKNQDFVKLLIRSVCPFLSISKVQIVDTDLDIDVIIKNYYKKLSSEASDLDANLTDSQELQFLFGPNEILSDTPNRINPRLDVHVELTTGEHVLIEMQATSLEEDTIVAMHKNLHYRSVYYSSSVFSSQKPIKRGNDKYYYSDLSQVINISICNFKIYNHESIITKLRYASEEFPDIFIEPILLYFIELPKLSKLRNALLKDKPDGTPGLKPDGTPGLKPDGTPGLKPDGTPGLKPDGTPGSDDASKHITDLEAVLLFFLCVDKPKYKKVIDIIKNKSEAIKMAVNVFENIPTDKWDIIRQIEDKIDAMDALHKRSARIAKAEAKGEAKGEAIGEFRTYMNSALNYLRHLPSSEELSGAIGMLKIFGVPDDIINSAIEQVTAERKEKQ